MKFDLFFYLFIFIYINTFYTFCYFIEEINVLKKPKYTHNYMSFV